MLALGALAGGRTLGWGWWTGAAGVKRMDEEVTVAQHPVIGYLLWAVPFGALFAWEGFGLARSALPYA